MRSDSQLLHARPLDVLDRLKGESLQVFGFRNGRDNRMVWCLRVDGHAAQDSVRVNGCVQDDFLKRKSIDMVRATKRGQRSAGLQQLQGAEMDFLVTAKRVGNRSAIAGEGGGVQDNHSEWR